MSEVTETTEGVTDGTSNESDTGQGTSEANLRTGSGNESGSNGGTGDGDAAATGSESSGNDEAQGGQQDSDKSAASEASEDVSLSDQIKDSTGDDPEKTTPENDGESQSGYDAFDLAEGLVLSETSSNELQGLLKGAEVPQEVAQEVMGLLATVQNEIADHIDKAEADQKQTWRKEAENDPVLSGKDGKQLKSNMAIAARGLERYAAQSEEKAAQVKEVYDSGVLDRPAVFHVLLEMGRATEPDSVGPTGDPAIVGSDKKEPYQVMYGYMEDGHTQPPE